MNDDQPSRPTAYDFDHSNLRILLEMFEQDANYERSLADLPDLLRRFAKRSFGTKLNDRDFEPLLQRFWPTLPVPGWDDLKPLQRRLVVKGWVETNSPETRRSPRAQKDFDEGLGYEESGAATVMRGPQPRKSTSAPPPTEQLAGRGPLTDGVQVPQNGAYGGKKRPGVKPKKREALKAWLRQKFPMGVPADLTNEAIIGLYGEEEKQVASEKLLRNALKELGIEAETAA